MTILLFILILSLLVFVHELGHFWAARRSGIGVLEFGFGFPPRLWGIKRGDTVYSINLIPFGGFVRLEGEMDASQTAPTSFANAPLRKKFFILAAGVLMNYALAWLLLTSTLTAGVTVDTQTLQPNRFQQVENVSTQVFVSADSPAAQAGLRSGDVIISINGQAFTDTEEVIAYTGQANQPPLEVVYLHENTRQTVVVEPRVSDDPEAPVYGFGLQTTGQLRYPWYVAPWYGLETTVSLTGQTFAGFGQLIRDLVQTGRVSEDLSGPVGIAVLTGQIRQLGLISILQFIAILSISLAVINFLPLPALDGGRALFVVIERLRGQSMNPKIEGAIHATGFYLLLLMIILISVRDVQRFDLVDRVLNYFR